MLSLRERQVGFGTELMGAAPVHGGLQIYRNNVFISLSTALADVYPVTQRLVGEAFFQQLARRFIRGHPARSGNLHNFGREFPAFIAALAEVRDLPYLSDVAMLERAYEEVFHAADADPLDVQRMAQRGSLEAQKFALHPAIRLMASRYPVRAIWQANQSADVGIVDLDAGPDWLLVRRSGLDRRIERLSSGEFALLSALGQGVALEGACAAAAAAEGQVDLGAAMARFVTECLFREDSSC
jgi:hypothetical protein